METNEGSAPGGAVLIGLATEIVAAYVSHNTIEAEAIPDLLRTVHRSLASLSEPLAPSEPLKPAVPVKKSIHKDYIVCLEDGLKFKSLKRHLRTKYDLSPDEYRARWDLPADYPMVAPGYSQQRSRLAKSMGLGRTDRKE